MKLFCDPMWDRFFQPQGSGLVTSATLYSPGGPAGAVPTSQTVGAASEPAPIKVKVLSMWPLDPNASQSFDFFPSNKEDAILPQYRFGEAELGKMHGQILRLMSAWEEVWRPYIRAALAAPKDYDRAWDVAEGIKAHVDEVMLMLGPTIEGLLLAANAGLSASSKAFNEVTAELRAWPASALPELIVKICINYTEAWSFTTEVAAGRFKQAAKAWMDVQTRLVALFADERQLRAVAYEGQKTRAEDAEKRMRELEQRVADLQRGTGLLDSIRENFEGVLKSGKDAVNKALNAVGSALPSLAGGLGFGLVLVLGLAAAAFALKR